MCRCTLHKTQRFRVTYLHRFDVVVDFSGKYLLKIRFLSLSDEEVNFFTFFTSLELPYDDSHRLEEYVGTSWLFFGTTLSQTSDDSACDVFETGSLLNFGPVIVCSDRIFVIFHRCASLYKTLKN